MLLDRSFFALLPGLLLFACSASDDVEFDANGDTIADDLGRVLDLNGDKVVDQIDIDQDGTLDGMGVDRDDDSMLDALVLDIKCGTGAIFQDAAKAESLAKDLIATAKALGITFRSLRYRLKKLGLED